MMTRWDIIYGLIFGWVFTSDITSPTDKWIRRKVSDSGVKGLWNRFNMRMINRHFPIRPVIGENT